MAGAVRRDKKLERELKLVRYLTYGIMALFGGAVFYGLPQGWGFLLLIAGYIGFPLILAIIAALLKVPVPDITPPAGGGEDYDSPVDVDPLHSLKSYVNYEEFIESKHDF